PTVGRGAVHVVAGGTRRGIPRQGHLRIPWRGTEPTRSRRRTIGSTGCPYGVEGGGAALVVVFGRDPISGADTGRDPHFIDPPVEIIIRGLIQFPADFTPGRCAIGGGLIRTRRARL